MARRAAKQEAMFDIDSPAATSTDVAEPPYVGAFSTAAEDSGVSGISGTPSAAEPVKPSVSRLSIPLTADGSAVDMNTMRPATADKLRKVIEMTPALMPDKATLGPDGNVLPDAAIDAVYGILGRLEAMAASTRFDRDISFKVFEYNERELAMLRPVTHPVINRYLKTYTKDRELIALVMVLAQVHFMKIAQLQMLTVNKNATAA